MSNYRNNNKCSWFWDYSVPFTRFWGIITSIVLCGVGVDIFVHHHAMGKYIILATVILFLMEIAWVITLFLNVCIHDKYSRIFSCWEGVLWIKHWRKTIIYIGFALALLLKPHHLWLTTVAGVMLIILGLLHFLLIWAETPMGYPRETLLNNQDDYCDRFDSDDISIAVGSKPEITGDPLNNNEQVDTKLEI